MAFELPRKLLSQTAIRESNARIVAILSAYLNLAPDAAAAEDIRDIAKECGVTEEYAFAQYLSALCGLDSHGKDRDFFRNYFPEMVHCLSTDTFTDDPYYRLIQPKTAEKGRFTLKTMELKPGEAFVCGDFKITEDLRMIPQIGFFMEPYRYPAVLENGREWMTLLPNETITTRPAIERARGKVLTYGLGLGYFAFMAARKTEVKAVTVVELSEDAIALFKEEILPLFPRDVADKIHLIRDDAFHFAKASMAELAPDFVFADIWHDVGDGRDLYLRMKEYESLCPNTEFCYWLEESILCYLDKRLWPTSSAADHF